MILREVDWFDPREPFAPYFLLYLPMSMSTALLAAAALIQIARLFIRRTETIPKSSRAAGCTGKPGLVLCERIRKGAL